MEIIRRNDDVGPKTKISTDSSFYGGLQINLAVKGSFDAFKIEVQGFNDFNLVWLNKIYKEYEGQIWTSFITSDDRMKFYCHFCGKVLCRFHTLRNHLNMHLEIYPFKCYACQKMYAGSNSLYKHRISKH